MSLGRHTPNTQSRLVQHVAFTRVEVRPAQLVGPPSQLAQHRIKLPLVRSFHISHKSFARWSCLARRTDRRSIHPPPLEVIVVLDKISSRQPHVTKITIPRYTPHRYVIYQKSSQSMTINHPVTISTRCYPSWKAGPSISSYMLPATSCVDIIMYHPHVNCCLDTPTNANIPLHTASPHV